MNDDEPTRLLRGLLAAVTDLVELLHSGPAARVMLAAAVAGTGCTGDAITRTASMPAAAVRPVILIMMKRCLRYPSPVLAKATFAPSCLMAFRTAILRLRLCLKDEHLQASGAALIIVYSFVLINRS